MRGPERGSTRELKAAMNARGLDGVVVVKPENVYYLSGTLIYTSWTLRERLALVVCPNGGEPTLIVCNIEESLAHKETWIKDLRTYVEFAESPVDVLADVLKEKGLEDKTVGIEASYFAMAYYLRLKQRLSKIALVDSDPLFDSLRAVKSPQEVAHLKLGVNVTEQAVYEAFAHAHVGTTEKDLANEMNMRQLALGADENAFCVLGAGLNTTIAHHFADSTQLGEAELLAVDIGSRFDGYHSDIARMAIGGQPTESQRDTYRRLREAQRETIAQIKPGVRACDIYNRVLIEFGKRGLTLKMPHIGHGLGIGEHEYPMIEPGNTVRLQEGMVIAIEPAHIEPGVGRYALEDIVQVTAHGPVILSDWSSTEELFSIK